MQIHCSFRNCRHTEIEEVPAAALILTTCLFNREKNVNDNNFAFEHVIAKAYNEWWQGAQSFTIFEKSWS